MASVWNRCVELQDGTRFTAYDISIRKHYKDRQSGEMRTFYSIYSSEINAVANALSQAAAWVLKAQAQTMSCSF